jgi:hypothetical protein
MSCTKDCSYHSFGTVQKVDKAKNRLWTNIL